MKRQYQTNKLKAQLLLSALFLGLLLAQPLYPPPDLPFPRPISKKLPGQPAQPPVKPLSTYTINIE